MPYDYHYPGTELETCAGATNWKEYWAGHVRPFVGKRVLDAGAGLGATARRLSAANGVEKWVCLEPDASMARQLAERISRDSNPACEAIIGDIASINKDERFDTILYVDVLEHIEDDAGELTQAASLLERGGHLVVLAPAHQWLFSPFDQAVGHFRRYSRTGLRQVGPAGLSCVVARYLDGVDLRLC